MSRLFFLYVFIMMILIFSCEDTKFMVNCSECSAEEPASAELYADLDPDYFYNAVVELWAGVPSDSIKLGTYIASMNVFTEFVTLNKKYTITATYEVDGDTYVAVDAAYPRVRYDKSQCDDACYYVYDRKCNLKLRK